MKISEDWDTDVRCVRAYDYAHGGYRYWGPPIGTIEWRMEWYNRPVKLETISRWVREGKLSEREALLLRGTPTTRGFRGKLWASLAWLENFSPGVTKRWVGDSKRGWKRNVGPANEAHSRPLA